MTLYEKLKAGEELTEEELHTFCFGMTRDWERLCENILDHLRWSILMETVLKHKESGEIWGCVWHAAVTACQEHEFCDQPVEYEAVQVTTTTYRAK